MLYVGFAIADGMFVGSCIIKKTPLEVEEAREILSQKGYVTVANPSHRLTFEALANKHSIVITPPPTAPKVLLNQGDEFLVLAVAGLPRLEGRHEYTQEEVSRCNFSFSLWNVLSQST